MSGDQLCYSQHSLDRHSLKCLLLECYNAFNFYCRELAPSTVSLTGYRAQGDDGKHCAYYSRLSCGTSVEIAIVLSKRNYFSQLEKDIILELLNKNRDILESK